MCMRSQIFLLLSVGDSNQYKELDDVVFKSLVDMDVHANFDFRGPKKLPPPTVVILVAQTNYKELVDVVFNTNIPHLVPIPICPT